MTIGLLTASYIISSVLFILALGGLSNQEKAKRAVWYGIVGMAIAVIATLLGEEIFLTEWLEWLIAAIIVGSIIGIIVAKKSSNDWNASTSCRSPFICWSCCGIYWY